MKFEEGMYQRASNIFARPFAKETLIRNYALIRGKEAAPEVAQEISSWVDRTSFGLEEIRQKKLALSDKPYSRELKAELSWVYDEQEKETLKEMDEVRDTLGAHILGEDSPGKDAS